MTASRRGFTIIELITALAIFSLVGVALTGVALANVRNNALAKETSDATDLAQSELEILRAAVTAPTNGGDTVGIFTRSWTVANGPVAGTTKEITVTVTWRSRGTRTVQLKTVVGT
jgi:prepilin-type N-terminal cleavage/methylation domain-containing protein